MGNSIETGYVTRPQRFGLAQTSRLAFCPRAKRLGQAYKPRPAQGLPNFP